ncbi:unnamed protein product [Ilex paraguariensis]|uniref:Uncharacterized protein n=1 Tax=Ilex paraguariensis TaxID=185542 RepID=A0ABC8UYW0_9AQUA
MAEETHKTAYEAPPKTEEVMVVSNVREVEKPSTTTMEKEAPPHPEPKLEKPANVEEVVEVEKEKGEEKITESALFKEESNVVGELPDPEKKVQDKLKALV